MKFAGYLGYDTLKRIFIRKYFVKKKLKAYFYYV